VEPACTLCFGSTEVPDPLSPASGGNSSCGETLDEVLRFTPSECTSFKAVLISNAKKCGCDHVGDSSPVFIFEGTGSVTISCPDGGDTCTPNGSFGGISGSFNIVGGVYASRDGGSTFTFQEGNGSATTITCTDGCTCELTDGSDCDTA
jgi:hypothetical protein